MRSTNRNGARCGRIASICASDSSVPSSSTAASPAAPTTRPGAPRTAQPYHITIAALGTSASHRRSVQAKPRPGAPPGLRGGLPRHRRRSARLPAKRRICSPRIGGLGGPPTPANRPPPGSLLPALTGSPLPSKGRGAGGVRLSPLPLSGRSPPQIALRSREPHPNPRRCHPPEPVWSPPEPPEREPPSQARPPPLPPVAAFPHPVLHACGAHPTDPPSRDYSADSRTRCSAGLPDGLTSPPGSTGPARPRRADDGSVSRAPATPGAPPARPIRRAGSRHTPSARSPRARGSLTYPKRPKMAPRRGPFRIFEERSSPGSHPPPQPTGSPFLRREGGWGPSFSGSPSSGGWGRG